MAGMIWALDFGDWSLKVTRGSVDRKTGAITVDLFDEIVYGELPCGYEAGPTEKHREGVIAFRSRYEIATGDSLCVSVPGNEVFSRFINLPPVLDSIDQIIRYEARQQIPFDIDDVVWDYQPVKDPAQIEEGEEIEVGLFALKQERVAELMDLLDPWRRNLKVVQNAPLAVYNFLEYEGRVDEPTVVVDVGSATTDVLVLNPPRFWIRTLLVAGGDLTNALMEQFGVGPEEAEKIKRRAGRSAHREQILRVVQPVFQDLTNEIQRSLGYYKSLVREIKFEKVVLLGTTMRMAGLDQMLAQGLQYNVEAVKDLKRIQLSGSVDRDKFMAALPGSCAALGLLVQGAAQERVHINMVPEEVAAAGAVAAKKPWILAAAVGVLLMAILFVVGERLYAQDLAQMGSRVEQQSSILNEVSRLESAYSSAASQVASAEQSLTRLTEAAVPPGIYNRLLSLLSSSLPEDVFLTSLSFQWVEPDQISVLETTGSLGRSTRGFRPGPGMPAMMDDPLMMDAMADPMGPPPGLMGGPQAAGRRPTGEDTQMPASSMNSKLVMQFQGESARLRDAPQYIREQVIGALQRAGVVVNGEQVTFSEVKMVGDPVEVWRSAIDGSLVNVSDRTATTDEVMPFVAFNGYAVVSIGEESGGAGAPPSP